MTTQSTSYRTYPAHTLEKALIIVTAIVDKGASKQMDRLLVADAVGRTPSSSEFKRLLSSSRAYGLTQGTEKADYIVPTALGLKILKPLQSAEVFQGRTEACLNVELLAKIMRQFNKQKLPDPKFLRNTLERAYGLSKTYAEEFCTLLTENAKFCGVLQDISGAKYIRLDEPKLIEADNAATFTQDQDLGVQEIGSELNITTGNEGVSATSVLEEKKPKLFLGHGKNRKPMDELKKILDGFGIHYVVAVDEPHAGRPISKKVADLMKECTAGIFVFTKDELLYKKAGSSDFDELWRPSENVVYELGAAGILWEKKIIILREEGVNFPSDFSDLGYITFQNEEISSRAMEIMKELITFKLLRLQAA